LGCENFLSLNDDNNSARKVKEHPAKKLYFILYFLIFFNIGVLVQKIITKCKMTLGAKIDLPKTNSFS
jgi:hypothetical protein